MPAFLRFDGDCLIVLRQTVLAVAPMEGCALLIGDENIDSNFHNGTIWNLRYIWPCNNIWEPTIFRDLEQSENTTFENEKSQTKHSRFAIDPLEQIKAQKWARERNWKILGTAHSHPEGEATPSRLDHLLAFSPRLMVIVSGSGLVRSWWIQSSNPSQTSEITHLNN